MLVAVAMNAEVPAGRDIMSQILLMAGIESVQVREAAPQAVDKGSLTTWGALRAVPFTLRL